MPPYDLLIPGKLGANVTKREGGGLALIQIFFGSLPCDASQTPLCMMPPYNLLIPGKLGCNVTKREGGGRALIQIFFFKPSVMLYRLPCMLYACMLIRNKVHVKDTDGML